MRAVWQTHIDPEVQYHQESRATFLDLQEELCNGRKSQTLSTEKAQFIFQILTSFRTNNFPKMELNIYLI